MNVGKAKRLYPGALPRWTYGNKYITRQSQILLSDRTRYIRNEVWGVATGGVAVV